MRRKTKWTVLGLVTLPVTVALAGVTYQQLATTRDLAASPAPGIASTSAATACISGAWVRGRPPSCWRPASVDPRSRGHPSNRWWPVRHACVPMIVRASVTATLALRRGQAAESPKNLAASWPLRTWTVRWSWRAHRPAGSARVFWHRPGATSSLDWFSSTHRTKTRTRAWPPRVYCRPCRRHSDSSQRSPRSESCGSVAQRWG